MFLTFPDGTVYDYDMDLLKSMLLHLDDWILNMSEIPVPELDLSDEYDWATGIAFVLCQKYIKSTYGFLDKVDPKEAIFGTGPYVEPKGASSPIV